MLQIWILVQNRSYEEYQEFGGRTHSLLLYHSAVQAQIRFSFYFFSARKSWRTWLMACGFYLVSVYTIFWVKWIMCTWFRHLSIEKWPKGHTLACSALYIIKHYSNSETEDLLVDQNTKRAIWGTFSALVNQVGVKRCLRQDAFSWFSGGKGGFAESPRPVSILIQGTGWAIIQSISHSLRICYRGQNNKPDVFATRPLLQRWACAFPREFSGRELLLVES